MKKILSVIIAIGLVSCATTQEREQAITRAVAMEADCKEIKDVKIGETVNTFDNTRYINATCDGKRIRCKQTFQKTGMTALSYSSNLACKERS